MPANPKTGRGITTKGRPEKRYALAFRPWSALQTHLQGVDGAALTVVTKERVHAALLS